MTKTWASRLVALAALTVTSPGLASPRQTKVRSYEGTWENEKSLVVDDSSGFAEERQWAFSTDAALAVERRTQVDTSATTTVSIYPAADYFVVKNLSLGGGIGIGYVRTGDFRALIFKTGPRIGYNFELGKLVSLWPKLGVLYSHTQSRGDFDISSGGDDTLGVRNNGAAITMFAPCMLLPTSHFFAGFGPFLDTDLSGKNRSTTWGFRLTMGGWL